MGRGTVILDVGGDCIRLGTTRDEEPIVHRNFLCRPKKRRKIYIGNEIDTLENFFDTNITRPFERGYMSSAEHQKKVLDHAITRSMRPSSQNVLITEPLFNFEKIQRSMDEILFEQQGFAGVVRQVGAKMASYCGAAGFDNRACIVIDSGFSFTHVVPIFDGCVLTQATKRIDVGGKLLTNYLKEIISFKSINLMDDFLLVDHIKQASCKCALDYEKYLEHMKVTRENVKYVLPTGETKYGYVKTDRTPLDKDTQSVRLKAEIINVPEILMNPSLVGIQQSGITELVSQCIGSLPPVFKDILPSNVMLCGGNVNFQGFKERIQSDLRKSVASHVPANVFSQQQPEFTVWRGAQNFAKTQDFRQLLVTRAEYEDYGSSICFRKWNIP